MANVLFKRGDNDTLKNTPFLDGLVFFNEENHRIYMDNGNKRYQYGGDTAIVSNPELATEDTVMSAKSTLDLFAQKRSVVDKVSDALAVTENNIPVGCLAFQDLYTDINHNVENQLSANNRRVDDLEDMMDVRTDDNQVIHIYFQQHNGKIGYNTDIKRGADTFTPFRELKTVYLGKTGQSYDLTSYDGWKDFTNDNFYFRVVSISMNANNNVTPNNNINNGSISGPSFSYDNKTGILTVGRANGSGSNDGGKLSWSISADISVYLVYA